MGWFKKLKKKVKSNWNGLRRGVKKYGPAAAAIGSMFIPGVGAAVKAGIGKVGSFLGLGNGAATGAATKAAAGGFFDTTLGKATLGIGQTALAGNQAESQIKLGNQLDMQNQKEMFDYRIQQGMAAGMTPYEMYMGPAAGAGGGTSGSGATLGNQPMQAAQANIQQQTALQQQETELKKTAMQTEATKYAADKAAEAQTGVAQMQTETQKLIAANQLQFNEKTYLNVTLPEASAKIGKTEAETDKLLNEVVTSTPEFVKFMKMLSMGVDNTLSAFLQNMDGYNLVDPGSVAKIPEHKRKEILAMLLAIQSGTLKNVEGLKKVGGDIMDAAQIPTMGVRDIKGANDHTRAAINAGG